MEKIDPAGELQDAVKPKKRTLSREQQQRMVDAAREANTRSTRERQQALEGIDRNPPKRPDELQPEALKELAKQLKHKDPRVRAAAMKEVFKLNRERDDDDPVAEIVYITPAMRDDAADIEELLQDALAEKVIDDAGQLDKPVPAFVPMGA